MRKAHLWRGSPSLNRRWCLVGAGCPAAVCKTHQAPHLMPARCLSRGDWLLCKRAQKIKGKENLFLNKHQRSWNNSCWFSLSGNPEYGRFIYKKLILSEQNQHTCCCSFSLTRQFWKQYQINTIQNTFLFIPLVLVQAQISHQWGMFFSPSKNNNNN